MLYFFSMRITVLGTGFVGVVSAAVYATHQNQVIGLDIDQTKIEQLRQGKVPFFEPGLQELLLEQQAAQTLKFTTSYEEAIPEAEAILIAVGTPSKESGEANLDYLFSAIHSLAPFIKDNAIIVIKSTVPPGTLDKVKQALSPLTHIRYRLAVMPEFLREGKAVEDTIHPDRIVIGTDDQSTYDELAELNKPFGAPIIRVKPTSAHLAKYASNAYLANRIAFINQIADLCEAAGGDVEEVIEAMGYDKRIGHHYWYPGFGYGGSCFPKDVSELSHLAQDYGFSQDLFTDLETLNRSRIPQLLDKYGKLMEGWDHKKVAVLGLSFKPQTNDMREAPSVYVIPYLLAHGAEVRGYDPQAISTAPYFIKEHERLRYDDSIMAAATDAEVIMCLIEWPEITDFDFSSLNRPAEEQWFIDARNQFSPEQVTEWGFNYVGVGR